jgi:hypothetical protein
MTSRHGRGRGNGPNTGAAKREMPRFTLDGEKRGMERWCCTRRVLLSPMARCSASSSSTLTTARSNLSTCASQPA